MSDVVKSVFAPILVGLTLAVTKGESLRGLPTWVRLRHLLNVPLPLWPLLALCAVGAMVTFSLLRVIGRLKEKAQNEESGILSHTYEGFDYLPFMSAQELFVVLNDGKTWTHRFGEVLNKRVVQEAKPVRVLVIHPRSEFLKTLLRKNGRELHVQLNHLRETFLAIEELSRLRPGLAEIRGHQLFNPYMLHLTEQVAIMHPYLLKERKELPIFTFSKDQQPELYSKIRSDAEELWRDAVPLASTDFALLDSISASFPTQI